MTTTTDRIHCVKCRVSTDNASSKVVPMSNGGTRIEAICWGCGSKKSRIQSGPKEGQTGSEDACQSESATAAKKPRRQAQTCKGRSDFMQPMAGTVVKADEKIVKVENEDDYEAVFTISFELAMNRHDYLRMHQARANKEGVTVTIMFDDDVN